LRRRVRGILVDGEHLGQHVARTRPQLRPRGRLADVEEDVVESARRVKVGTRPQRRPAVAPGVRLEAENRADLGEEGVQRGGVLALAQPSNTPSAVWYSERARKRSPVTAAIRPRNHRTLPSKERSLSPSAASSNGASLDAAPSRSAEK
jgi:hypothetical protein